RAEAGDCPIMFSKRSIGTNVLLPLHDRTYTARQVATQILRYLKGMAEQALGCRVPRAGGTPPPSLHPHHPPAPPAPPPPPGPARALAEHRATEPVASALPYLRGETRDPLRVLTYDLGGGTFDVTVLERREGVVSVKAFDGDRLLGGYNFDRALVEWLLARLR